MKPEEQRIAIAEVCGFYGKPNWGLRGLTMQHFERSGFHTPVPDYLNDLNAMHEAEKTLRQAPQTFQPGGIGHYSELLHKKLGAERKCFATASQRAEAFLRTIGKWKDE